MKKLIATAVLLALGTGTALAEGGDSNTWIHKTMQQVQSGNYRAPINQNGEERSLGR